MNTAESLPQKGPVSSDAWETACDLACETLYRFLSAALSDPHSPGFAMLQHPATRQLAMHSADILRERYGAAPPPLGPGELPIEYLDVRPIAEQLSRPASELAEEYVAVFGLTMCRECPPYETEYHACEDPFFRSQQMADLAGFYRAFGLEPAASRGERADHVALELEFAALLLMKQRLADGAPGNADPSHAQICRDARASFVRDHLSWWLPSFSRALRGRSEGGFYGAAATLLAAYLPVERARLGIDPPATPARPRSPAPADEEPGCLVELRV